MIKKQIKRIKFADTLPFSYKNEFHSAALFAKQTQRFLDENFKGAYIKTDMPEYDVPLKFAPDGVAYFTRLIFKKVWGEQLVKVSISRNERTFTLRFDYDGTKVEFSNEEIEELLDVSFKSGYYFKFDEDGASLFIDYIPPTYITVRAMDTNYILQSYVRMFFYYIDNRSKTK